MTTTGRSADARRTRRGPSVQWLLGLLIALAIGASIAMIFSSSRSVAASLAVIAALWAAVIGAILVTKFRRQVDSAESKARDLRLVYELQLEREITARRQYELGVETQIRKEVRAETNEELGELKAQVQALRASLEQLIGGDLPEERVALQAERYRELDRARSAYPMAEAKFDDGAVAERDFADTAPEPGSGEVPVAPPNTMTEVIPIVTDDHTDAASQATARPAFVDETPTDEWAVAPAEVVPDLSSSIPAPSTPTPDRTPASAAEQMPTQQPPYTGGRHGRAASGTSTPAPASTPVPEPTPQPAPAPDPVRTPAPAARTADRHRAPDPVPGAHEAGRSAAELMDQLRAGTGGGRRRRRED